MVLAPRLAEQFWLNENWNKYKVIIWLIEYNYNINAVAKGYALFINNLKLKGKNKEACKSLL